MPRGLSKAQKAYVKEVFTELLDIRRETQEQLADRFGIDQTSVSRARKDGTSSVPVLIAAASHAGRSSAEIAKVVGVPIGSLPLPVAGDDPKIGTFLLRYGEVPGLKEWLTLRPEAATVREVWTAIRAYDKTPTLSRTSDGQPIQGWDRFFEDLRSGQVGVPSKVAGTATASLAIEDAQVPRLPATSIPKARTKTRGK